MAFHRRQDLQLCHRPLPPLSASLLAILPSLVMQHGRYSLIPGLSSIYAWAPTGLPDGPSCTSIIARRSARIGQPQLTRARPTPATELLLLARGWSIASSTPSYASTQNQTRRVGRPAPIGQRGRRQLPKLNLRGIAVIFGTSPVFTRVRRVSNLSPQEALRYISQRSPETQQEPHPFPIQPRQHPERLSESRTPTH
ncbi:hypothetical protein A4X13_0g7190 [Tilletia indica]|uniref:Uncharacterized protein n=1 Tax=Tilletia indica TaxID=43049 RepID=A0A177T7Y8_9BASI|nr:hypothetical protein A4X13_0g7190 [Tilletia indica]